MTKTFCIAIDSYLSTKTCPLDKGACYWQHRKTKDCKYTEQDITPEEFCSLVDSDYTLSDLDEFRDRLRLAL